MKTFSSILFLLLFVFISRAQNPDNLAHRNDSIRSARETKKENYSGPRRAAIMSALLPGLGQAFNKKYWKIPIIYVGIGGLGYMAVTNHKEYIYYRKNLIAENDGDPNTLNETRYDSENLQILKKSYKKNRDLAMIGISIIYMLNIIDANVDAHLKTFDVSDDLSLHLDPWHSYYVFQNKYTAATGISLTLQFK